MPTPFLPGETQPMTFTLVDETVRKIKFINHGRTRLLLEGTDAQQVTSVRPLSKKTFQDLGLDPFSLCESMPNIRDIVSHVTLLLDNRVSLDEFGDWMLLYIGKIMFGGDADNATRQLAYAIQSHMTEFDIGQINEQTLRRELANAIQPFSSSTL
jgi:hypothetical protein